MTKSKENVWVTMAGEHIVIEDMPNRHLINSIKMVIRNTILHKLDTNMKNTFFVPEKYSKGKVAQFYINKVLQSEWQALLPSKYQALLTEAIKRQIFFPVDAADYAEEIHVEYSKLTFSEKYNRVLDLKENYTV